MLNRQQRRKQEREIDKEMSPLKKLPSAELKKVNDIIEKTVEIRTNNFMEMIDRGMSAVLVGEGWTFQEIRKIQDKLSELVTEDCIKIKELDKENVDMIKIQEDVKNFIIGLIDAGKDKKEFIEETSFKFPKLSKSMILNAYGKIKEERELEEAAEYILEDAANIKEIIEHKKEKKDKNKKVSRKTKPEEVNEIPFSEEITEVEKELIKAEVEKDLVEDLEKEKVIKGLKIVEEEVIKSLKLNGINGDYTAKTGIGVVVENEGYKLGFSNIEELEVFYREVREVFTLI